MGPPLALGAARAQKDCRQTVGLRSAQAPGPRTPRYSNVPCRLGVASRQAAPKSDSDLGATSNANLRCKCEFAQRQVDICNKISNVQIRFAKTNYTIEVAPKTQPCNLNLHTCKLYKSTCTERAHANPNVQNASVQHLTWSLASALERRACTLSRWSCKKRLNRTSACQRRSWTCKRYLSVP